MLTEGNKKSRFATEGNRENVNQPEKVGVTPKSPKEETASQHASSFQTIHASNPKKAEPGSASRTLAKDPENPDDSVDLKDKNKKLTSVLDGKLGRTMKAVADANGKIDSFTQSMTNAFNKLAENQVQLTETVSLLVPKKEPKKEQPFFKLFDEPTENTKNENGKVQNGKSDFFDGFTNVSAITDDNIVNPEQMNEQVIKPLHNNIRLIASKLEQLSQPDDSKNEIFVESFKKVTDGLNSLHSKLDQRISALEKNNTETQENLSHQFEDHLTIRDINTEKDNLLALRPDDQGWKSLVQYAGIKAAEHKKKSFRDGFEIIEKESPFMLEHYRDVFGAQENSTNEYPRSVKSYLMSPTPQEDDYSDASQALTKQYDSTIRKHTRLSPKAALTGGF